MRRAFVCLGIWLCAAGLARGDTPREAVVRIGGCSGFCVSADGIVLTAKHCGLGERETIRFPDRPPVRGERVYVGPDAEDAVAFLVPGGDWPFLPVAEAVPPAGSRVWSGGYPAGSNREFRSTTGKLTGGGEHVLKRNGTELGRFPANVTTLVTGPGWSGGPLVSEDGEAIGILSAGNDDGSTFVSWAATRRAFEAARSANTAADDERPHLLVFGFEGCPHCERFLADHRAGRFSQFKVEYVDVGTDEGRKRYEALRTALRNATGAEQPRGFPAFHLAGRATMTVGYATPSGCTKLLAWIRDTLRLPATFVDAVVPPESTGVTPDTGADAGGAGESDDASEGVSLLPTGRGPPGDELPFDESVPWWSVLAGVALRVIEERVARKEAGR